MKRQTLLITTKEKKLCIDMIAHVLKGHDTSKRNCISETYISWDCCNTCNKVENNGIKISNVFFSLENGIYLHNSFLSYFPFFFFLYSERHFSLSEVGDW